MQKGWLGFLLSSVYTGAIPKCAYICQDVGHNKCYGRVNEASSENYWIESMIK